MREIRQSGSEGGAIQANVSFLPLSEVVSMTPLMSAISDSHLLRGNDSVDVYAAGAFPFLI